jgi:hypothetical protein
LIFILDENVDLLLLVEPNICVYWLGVLPFRSNLDGAILVLPVDLPDIKSCEEINTLFLDKA